MQAANEAHHLPDAVGAFLREAGFGGGLALQHRRGNRRHGYHIDNFLGRLPQRNPWTDDGHEFFARHRVLRCRELLGPDEHERIVRFAERLKELIPAQPPALLHGDLWTASMMVGPAGEPAVIGPGAPRHDCPCRRRLRRGGEGSLPPRSVRIGEAPAGCHPRADRIGYPANKRPAAPAERSGVRTGGLRGSPSGTLRELSAVFEGHHHDHPR